MIKMITLGGILLLIGSVTYLVFFSKNSEKINLEKKRLKQDIGFLLLKVDTYLKKPGEFDLSIIIKADHYLQRFLKLHGLFIGKSIGESLKGEKSKKFFLRNELNTLWEYRKIRNRVVHEELILKKDEILKISRALKILKSKL